MLYNTLVTSQLDYAVSVRNPKFYYLINSIEKVKKEQQRCWNSVEI